MDRSEQSLRSEVSDLTATLRDNPRDPETLQSLGLGFIRLGSLKKGVNLLERSSFMRPLNAAMRIELAIAYGLQGRIELAIDLLMLEACEQPLTADEFLRVARGLDAFDKPELAMEACRRAGRLAFDRADIHQHMARFASRCGRPAAAIEALLKRAVDLEPDSIDFRMGLVTHLMLFQRIEEAAGVIRSLIPSHLSQLHCPCCTSRLVQLFNKTNEPHFRDACLARLEYIQSSP